MDVARVQLHRIKRRPLRGDETAVAIVLDVIAAGDTGVLKQPAGANGQRRADHLVDVEHHPLGVVGAESGVHVVEALLGRRLLGHDVDRAAGGATTGKGRTRPAQDLDLFGEEVFAHADAGVADAVEEDVVAGIEAADEEAIAEGVASLAGAERHAGGGEHRLLQRGRVLVFQHFPCQHGDRFWRVEDRFGKFA